MKRVPYGRVATYGQIAREAGMEAHARLVGYALHACQREFKFRGIVSLTLQVAFH